MIKEILKNYIPYNQQEEKDKQFLLQQLSTNQELYTRENTAMHFTASCWIINQNKDKVCLIYHKIYQSWSWCGGHADGEKDLLKVAQKELFEETGLQAKLVSEIPLSIEILPVEGHIKKNAYVSSHLHLNVTYLFQANDNDPFILNEQETNGIAWFDIDEIEKNVNEVWMMKNIYQKLIDKVKGGYYDSL